MIVEDTGWQPPISIGIYTYTKKCTCVHHTQTKYVYMHIHTKPILCVCFLVHEFHTFTLLDLPGVPQTCGLIISICFKNSQPVILSAPLLCQLGVYLAFSWRTPHLFTSLPKPPSFQVLTTEQFILTHVGFPFSFSCFQLTVRTD